mgnify:CR=1 FL=1
MNTKLKKIAGQQLQLLRLEKNLTQEQMSEKLNLSTSAYCKIEYGENGFNTARLDKNRKGTGYLCVKSIQPHRQKYESGYRQQLQKQQQQ